MARSFLSRFPKIMHTHAAQLRKTDTRRVPPHFVNGLLDILYHYMIPLLILLSMGHLIFLFVPTAELSGNRRRRGREKAKLSTDSAGKAAAPPSGGVVWSNDLFTPSGAGNS